MIDRITVGKIMDAANIVDVVSDFVTLKRAGANLKGLCPFHDDRTPSFMVSPAKNYCKCFACGEGGSPVGFIMKHENLSYPDALRYLAKKYGIQVEEKEMTAEERQSQDDRESMFIVNEWAREWFSRQLHDTPDGRAIGLAYFRQRGFRDDIIRKFQLGYCPDSRTGLLGPEALKAGYQEKYLTNIINEQDPQLSVGTGLCIKRDDGSLRDRFRGRVIWPIFTMSGRVAGFGGRVLDAATKGVNVKYLNSPESIVYSKRKELFGLYQAKDAIRKKDCCYMVEGYTDVMGMHQAGVENVVSSSGTALTKEQVRLIHRLTNNMVVIFDGDEAGIHASERGMDMFLSEGMSVKLLLLPDGDDPDSFAHKHTAEEFQRYLAEHQVDFIQYKASHLLAEAENDVDKMSKLVHNIAETIAVIPDEITRTLYVKQAARLLNFKESLIAQAVTEERKRANEEKLKEENRRLEREANAMMPPEDRPVSPRQPAATEGDTSPLYDRSIPVGGNKSSSPVSEGRGGDTSRRLAMERTLAEMMIRYGEKVAFCIDDENGNEIPLSVLEFIELSLEESNLAFLDPRHQRILEEGLEHVKDEGFTTMTYFTNHPDYEINSLAAELSNDRIPLSKCHGDQPIETQLDELIPRQIDSIRLEIARNELQELTGLISRTAKDCTPKERMQLLAQFQEKQKLVQELARNCGERVLMSMS